jgi:hypothetical protein
MALILVCLLATAPSPAECTRDKARLILLQPTASDDEAGCMQSVRAFLAGAEVYGAVDSAKDGFKVFCTPSFPS